MAASDAKLFAVKNVAYRASFSLYKDGIMFTGAASLDSEISKDFGSYTDCTNEATEIGTSATYYLDLTSTEMNADEINIIIKSSNADTMHITITTTESDIETNISTLLSRLTSTRAGYLDELLNLTTTLSTIGTNITTLLNRLTSTRAGYLDELLNLNAEVSGIESDLDTITTNLATANTNISTINTNVNTANTNINTILGYTDTLETNLATANTNINTINTTVNTINTNVNTANTNINTIDGLVDNLTTNLATANSNIVIIDGLVDSLTTNLATANSNILIIAGYTDSIESSLSTANSGIVTIDGIVDTLLSRIDVTLSTRSATGDAMALTSSERTTLSNVVNTTLTTAHGSGSWTTGSGGGGTDVNVISLSEDALAQIESTLSSISVTVQSPVSTTGNEVTIYRGDAYLIANSRHLQFTISNLTGLETTCTMYIDLGNKILSFSGTVATSGNDSIVKIELTSSNTLTLITGRFNYRIEVLYDNTTNSINIITGIINILSQFG